MRSISCLLVCGLLCVLALAGCSETETIRRDILFGRLVSADDGQPIASARVALFDVDRFQVVAVGDVDLDGEFAFQPTTSGNYVPVVTKRGYRVFGLPRTSWSLGMGSRRVEVEIPLIEVEPFRDTGLRLPGVVVDDETGQPVFGAQVEVSSIDQTAPNFSEFTGNSSTVEPITGHDGRFVIFPLSQMLIPGEDDPITPSVRVQAPGYFSFSAGPWPLPDIPDTLRVRLRRGQDDGRIRGRVVDLAGDAVAGVPIHLEWRGAEGAMFKSGPTDLLSSNDLPSTLPKLLAPTRAVTDLDGNYIVGGLAPGRYYLVAAPRPDDGFVGSAIAGVEVVADSTGVVSENLLAVPAVEMDTPQDGGRVARNVELRWRSVASAARYTVLVTRGDGVGGALTLEDNFFQLAELEDFVVDGALYRWTVTAFDADDVQLTGSDRPWLFRVVDP